MKDYYTRYFGIYVWYLKILFSAIAIVEFFNFIAWLLSPLPDVLFYFVSFIILPIIIIPAIAFVAERFLD
jgi:hypothetical protein